MKTRALPAAPIIRDDLPISEEVLLTDVKRNETIRVLVPVALVVCANYVHIRVPFELRRLNQELVASFDGEKIHGRTDIVTVLPMLDNFLEHFGQAVIASLNRQQ